MRSVIIVVLMLLGCVLVNALAYSPQLVRFMQNPECAMDEQCDDSNPCTRNFCNAGVCTFVALYCEPGMTMAQVACQDDGNPCTYDVCNTQAQCVHLSMPDATACPSDGNSHTTDRCRCGQCTHRSTNLMDTDNDVVDADDLAALLEKWGQTYGETNYWFDLDFDCEIGAADLAQLLTAWGPSKPE
jgi:hypothetical protein